jgi:hypothetical protein
MQFGAVGRKYTEYRTCIVPNSETIWAYFQLCNCWPSTMYLLTRVIQHTQKKIGYNVMQVRYMYCKGALQPQFTEAREGGDWPYGAVDHGGWRGLYREVLVYWHPTWRGYVCRKPSRAAAVGCAMQPIAYIWAGIPGDTRISARIVRGKGHLHPLAGICQRIADYPRPSLVSVLTAMCAIVSVHVW